MNNDELQLHQTNFKTSNTLIPISIPTTVNYTTDNRNNNNNNNNFQFSRFQNTNTNFDNSDLNYIDFNNLVNSNNINFPFLQNEFDNSSQNINKNDEDRLKTNSNNDKKRKKVNGNGYHKHPKKKKKKAHDPNSQFKRKNIKNIITENKLNESTLKALEEEKKRQERLTSNNNFSDNDLVQTSTNFLVPNYIELNGINELKKEENEKEEKKLLNESSSNSSNKSSDQSVYIIDDENDVELIEDDIILDEPSKKNEDDDDCMLISESERQQDDEARYKKKLCGMHMNDDLNVPDVNGQVLVNVNHPLEDEDVFLLPYISKNIKPHQIGGIRFIYDNIIESLSRVKIKDSGFGCILAHAMGLGKTLQTIAFVEVFLRCTGFNKQRVLSIVPINTLQNWLSEFNYWLPENGQQKLDNDTIINYNRPFKVYVINDLVKNFKQRIEIILNWKSNGGVLLIGYEMFRTLVTNTHENMGKQSKASKIKNKEGISAEEPINLDEEVSKSVKFEDAKEALLTPCLVVCDEGHRIKNSSANIAKTLQRIKTKRRIVLTGYPLQNNLIEYWCMVDFVRPNYLGTKAEFSNMFERPIMNGQCVDSTREDVKLMRFRAHVLHSLLEGFVQRRGHDVFFDSLPKKQEYVILLKLSPVQKELYLAFMEAIGAMNQGEKSNPLRSFAICCKIWNHPDVLYKFNQLKENEIDLDLPELQQQQQQQNLNNKKNSSKVSAPNNNYISLSNHVMLECSGFNPFAAILNNNSSYKSANLNNDDWANKILETHKTEILENGAKFDFSFTLIEQSVLAGDKILLFSQSLLSLNLIEEFLQKMNVPNTNEKWEKFKNYYRLDGSTSSVEREKLINSFNKTNNRIWLFLLSTRAGCLGINLIGANRVIVLDASWNPCHDSQAVCRVYRYGQTKNCYIYRLIADHTMEKKIYDRQISKQTMSDRVVDEIQTENHFTRTEVEKLIHFVKEDVPCADLTDLDKKYDDKVLVSSCLKHANVITKEPFTHESLLLDKKEYKLSEREKAMAFRNYNHDKKYFPLTRSNSTSLLYQHLNYSSSNQMFHSPHPIPNYGLHRFVSPNNKIHISASSCSLSDNNNKYEQTNYGLDFNLNKSFPQIDSRQQNNNTNKVSLNVKNVENIFDNNLKCENNSVTNCKQQEQTESILPSIQNENLFKNLRDVKISSFIAPSKLVIPASSNNLDQATTSSTINNDQLNSSIVIEPGQKVYILKTQKGCYLRTPDKKFIALRNKNTEDTLANFTVQQLEQEHQQQKAENSTSSETPLSNYQNNTFVEQNNLNSTSTNNNNNKNFLY